MLKQIAAKKETWENTWKKQKGVPFDKTTLRIFKEFQDYVNIRNKETIELGAGIGRLSYLALKNGAKKVTLLDYSKNALNLAKTQFGRKSPKFEMKQADLFKFKSRKKYDIVFSSGLIEHFRGKKFDDCIKKHFELSKSLVVFIIPASPHYNDIRVRTKNATSKFGWQKPMTLRQVKKAVIKHSQKIITNHRFHTFYGVVRLRGWYLPEYLDKRMGGLILTVCKKKK
jgi:cyclopropane fatty-acyl-phospholipid synthase-like methyltransferase